MINFLINRTPQIKLLLADALLPLTCLLCHQSCEHPYSVCSACSKLIISPITTSPITTEETIRYLAAYKSPTKELITQGKFQNNLASLKLLGQLFAEKILAQGYDTELVLIPVPLHVKKLQSRGFNQAYEIALQLAKKLSLRINEQCLIRIKEGKIQHFLSRKQRQNNAQDIFQISAKVPKKVAVIDDVYTTGATMDSICECLKQAGVVSIEKWVVAKTPKPSEKF